MYYYSFLSALLAWRSGVSPVCWGMCRSVPCSVIHYWWWCNVTFLSLWQWINFMVVFVVDAPLHRNPSHITACVQLQSPFWSICRHIFWTILCLRCVTGCVAIMAFVLMPFSCSLWTFCLSFAQLLFLVNNSSFMVQTFLSIQNHQVVMLKDNYYSIFNF